MDDVPVDEVVWFLASAIFELAATWPKPKRDGNWNVSAFAEFARRFFHMLDPGVAETRVNTAIKRAWERHSGVNKSPSPA